MKITISDSGEVDGREVHDVDALSASTVCRTSGTSHRAEITLDPGQAMAIAYDLLYQLVDAGILTGWNVQLPERDHAVA